VRTVDDLVAERTAIGYVLVAMNTAGQRHTNKFRSLADRFEELTNRIRERDPDNPWLPESRQAANN